jgi:hypothetical protein
VIVSLHAATGAAMGAAVRSPVAAMLLGPVLHVAGDRVPHRDIANRRFEITSGVAAVTLLGLVRGPLDSATVGALATCAPDVEHVIRLPRPGGSKLFHGRRGWHRSGRFSAPAQLLLAGFVLGWLCSPQKSAHRTVTQASPQHPSGRP